MKVLKIFPLFASLSTAHSVIRMIDIDGTAYRPYYPTVDAHLEGVRRIEWGYKNYIIPNSPIQDVKDPGLACQQSPVPPVLKATARAGAMVTAHWSPIIRMHAGPVMAYMARLISPNANPNELYWFKIYEDGFDAKTGLWANMKASDKNNSFSFQIPSDIQAGTYVLRPELLSLHGNEAIFQPFGNVKGAQYYPHCFNVDIIGNGAANPPGVKFPGAYKSDEIGITFNPYVGDDVAQNIEKNSKYVIPGPPVYKGRYDAPTGKAPVVKETGAYPPELQAKYETVMKHVDNVSALVIDAVNEGWPKNSPYPTKVMDVWMPPSGKFWKAITSALSNTYTDVTEFKKELTKAGIKN